MKKLAATTLLSAVAVVGLGGVAAAEDTKADRGPDHPKNSQHAKTDRGGGKTETKG